MLAGRITRPAGAFTKPDRASITVYAYGSASTMILGVKQLYLMGKQLTRAQMRDAHFVVGDLRIEHRDDPLRKRPVQIARLLDEAKPPGDLMTPLYNAQIGAMARDSFTINGFVRLADTDYGQTWLVTVTPESLGQRYDRRRGAYV